MSTLVDQLGVLSSTRPVVERSRYVRIDEGAIAGLAPGLARRVKPPAWRREWHLVDETERTANWLLVLDALNFSFWGEPRWRIQYRGETLDGYAALAAALSRATEEGVPIYDAAYLEGMSQGDLEHVLRGEGSIPLLDRRLQNLHEVGEVLLDRYHGSFTRAIEACDNSAARLVRLVVDNFRLFDDFSDYAGVEVRFYKRAQILVSDLYGAFGGQRWGHFDDLDQLTAFADYKLPQILRHMGVLTYIGSLAEKVDNRFLLPPASREEVEIRANTIWAVEKLRQELARHGNSLRAFELDWWLWEESQQLGAGARPYHLTRTIYY